MIRGGVAGKRFENALRQICRAGGTILDLGTPERFHKELRPYETLFAGLNYRAFGYRPSADRGQYNCDGHQDIECLTFGDGEADAVICLDVLEHVGNPFCAAKEIWRALRPGGLLLLTVPFQLGYHGKDGGDHDHDSYPDYWRMTHSGLRYLFSKFAHLEVEPVDGPLEFRARQLYLGPLIDMRVGRWLMDHLDRPRLGGTTSRHMLFGRK